MKPVESSDGITAAVSEVAQAVEEAPEGVEATSEAVKILLRKLYDLLQNGFNSKMSEEIDAKVLDFLRGYLASQNEFFISQYVDNYSNKQVEKKVAAILLLCLSEGLLSGIFVRFMADTHFKSNYGDKALLLDPKVLVRVIDDLQKLEQKRVILKNKWVEAYREKRGAAKDSKPRIHFEATPAAKEKVSKLDRLGEIRGVDLTDSVKAYISDQKRTSAAEFESHTKQQLRKLLMSHVSPNTNDRIPSSAKLSVSSDPQRINQLYDAVLLKNLQAASETSSLEESKETFLNEEVLNSQVIYDRYILPSLHWINKFNPPQSKINLEKTQGTAVSGAQKCPDCGQDLTSGFFGVKSSEKLPFL